jgi:hypothetical protein
MAIIYTCLDAACTSTVASDVFLIPSEHAAQIDLLVQGGFSEEAFGVAFGGMLLLWVTGLGIGFILNLIKKGNKV